MKLRTWSKLRDRTSHHNTLCRLGHSHPNCNPALLPPYNWHHTPSKQSHHGAVVGLKAYPQVGPEARAEQEVEG